METGRREGEEKKEKGVRMTSHQTHIHFVLVNQRHVTITSVAEWLGLLPPLPCTPLQAPFRSPPPFLKVDPSPFPRVAPGEYLHPSTFILNLHVNCFSNIEMKFLVQFYLWDGKSKKV